jgi:outer membrane biosynthesis protein TonB
MAPEANGELDTFLRRAAQVAAFGAAVGAAVGAVRGASRRGEDREAAKSVQHENGDQERSELQQQEEPSARESEPSEPEEEQEEPRQEPRAADEETTEDDSDEEPEEQESAPVDERVGSSDGQVNGEAAEIVKGAMRQVQQLTGHEAEGVLGLRRNDDGWTVTVEVVELSRVPSSTDVLASYDVVLDGDGELREYNRTGRYVRGRADPSEQ